MRLLLGINQFDWRKGTNQSSSKSVISHKHGRFVCRHVSMLCSEPSNFQCEIERDKLAGLTAIFVLLFRLRRNSISQISLLCLGSNLLSNDLDKTNDN